MSIQRPSESMDGKNRKRIKSGLSWYPCRDYAFDTDEFGSDSETLGPRKEDPGVIRKRRPDERQAEIVYTQEVEEDA